MGSEMCIRDRAIDGRVVAVTGKQGDKVVKGEIIAFVEGAKE